MASETVGLINELNIRRCRLSKSYRAIAAFIEEHYERVPSMTAMALAREVNVSESTVVRFANALGYEGYPALLKALQYQVRKRLTTDERFSLGAEIPQEDVLSTVLKEDMRNIRQTIDQIDSEAFTKTVDTLLSARHIYVIGLRSAAPLAQFMTYYLNFVFDNVSQVPSGLADVFEGLLRIQPEDALIGISFPRYSTRTVEAMRFAHSAGARVIAITDSVRSPLNSVADLCLTASTEMPSFVDSLAAPLSLINALIVAIGLKKREELHAHLTRLEEVWSENGVYLRK
ncbi:MAG: MurR/RpiR family transcriptional regulator [Clostridia bacterium]|nr:MurR/RpiR family transcriptional regulator [Clostridia bacterium]